MVKVVILCYLKYHTMEVEKTIRPAISTIAYLVIFLCYWIPAKAQVQDSIVTKRVSMIAEDLGISHEQAGDVITIIDSDQVQAKALIRETYLQLSRQLETLAAQRNIALKEILTDEQFEKMKKNLRRDELWSSEGTPSLPVR